jgi:two-component system response regulator FlrC
VPTLLESELFGHEKGAFTGAAARKPGKLELANNGTILLDEIADMDKNLQSKILRTLQEKTVDRVGGDEPVKVDVRIIAATNRDIEKMVSEGAFREDLFYRINVIPVHLPPLRERKEDIPPLAKYFMEKYSKKYYRNCIKISEDALNYLVSLNYQGNIRELENMIERAVILAQKDEIIDIAHFGSFGSPGYNGPAAIPKAISEARVHQSMSLMRAGDGEAVSRENESGITSLSIKEMEEKLIIAALKETNGNRTKAAEKLGITARTLRNKLKELNLSDV